MKKIVFVAAVVMFLAVILTSSTNAAIPNRFVQVPGVDSDVSYVKILNGLKEGYEFGVFDVFDNNGDPNPSIMLLSGGDSSASASFKVYFKEDENCYKLEVTDATDSDIIGQTLTLGGSPDFSFFIKDSNGNYHVNDLNIKDLENHMYRFSYSNSGYVEGYDLQAVPIPASFLLLSSAGGLVLIARRNKF